MRQSSDKLALKKQTIACLTSKESNALLGGACTPLEIHTTGTSANHLYAVLIVPKKPISK